MAQNKLIKSLHDGKVVRTSLGSLGEALSDVFGTTLAAWGVYVRIRLDSVYDRCWRTTTYSKVLQNTTPMKLL